jgi:hypothetical protein
VMHGAWSRPHAARRRASTASRRSWMTTHPAGASAAQRGRQKPASRQVEHAA